MKFAIYRGGFQSMQIRGENTLYLRSFMDLYRYCVCSELQPPVTPLMMHNLQALHSSVNDTDSAIKMYQQYQGVKGVRFYPSHRTGHWE